MMPKSPRNPAPPALEALPPVRQNGQFLLDYLCENLPGLSRRAAKSLVDDRVVFVNGRRIWMARHPLQRRDAVEVHPAALAAVRRRDLPPPPVPILYEDDACLVADKPAGLLSVGDRSLETRLRAQTSNPALAAVHRLDKDTTGCLLFAKSRDARDALVRAFEEGAVTKVYRAICIGTLPSPTLEITRPVDRLPALSRVRVLSSSSRPACAHVAVSIATGRTHQIRIHLHQIGCPIVGDRQYFNPAAERFRAFPRQMLHAHSLRFPSPLDPSRTLSATSPLPRDFRDALRTLRLT